ncbi:MAG: FUSC family protein [Acetobacteraceae bacterium]|nr:FUSC family protein [Acetobacteraceae bacterium]
MSASARPRATAPRIWAKFGRSVGAILPPLLFGIRLWAAVCLALIVAFWLELDDPSWAGTSAAIVCQPVLGASLRKGWFRLIGTVVGAIGAVVLTACFPQSRAGFLIGLALWAGVCAFVATLLRNFASYAAALAGYTLAIIAGNELGSVGGANGDAFNLALTRGTEIWVGIVCAGLVLATTDLGGTRRRLASMLTGLAAETASGLMRTLGVSGAAQAASRTARRRLLARVSGLDPVIDQASGEIATLPFRPRTLQAAVEGLTGALLAWRVIANYLEYAGEADADRADVRRCLSPEVLALEDGAARAMENAGPTRATLRAAARRLVAMRAETPGRRMLADSAAAGLLGLSRALTGVLALGEPRLSVSPRQVARLRVPDLLPPLINGVRAFLTVGGVSLLWIWLAWPGGSTAIVFGAVIITLLAPQEDMAFAAARAFTIGTGLTAICAAIVDFAILPQVTTLAGFCASLALVLVPAGALLTQGWQPVVFTAVAANFMPLLGPANLMAYDPETYYNFALALFTGIALAMLMFRLVPPLTPAARTQRLLALTLRDLRRLCRGTRHWRAAEWEQHVYGRLSALPASADILQPSRLAAMLPVGIGLIRLRRIASRFGLGADLDAAIAAVAAGDSAAAIRALAVFDAALAGCSPDRPGRKVRLRARGTILSVTDALRHYGTYFDARVAA